MMIGNASGPGECIFSLLFLNEFCCGFAMTIELFISSRFSDFQ